MPKIIRDKLAKKNDDASNIKEDHLAFGGADNLNNGLANFNLYGSDNAFDIKSLTTISNNTGLAAEEAKASGNCLFQPDLTTKIIVQAGISCAIKFGNGELTLQDPVDDTLEVLLSALYFDQNNEIN